MKVFKIIVPLVALSIACHAQQHATVTQYMFNGLAINPAYAGSQGSLNASFLSRFQNVGLPGAPTTQTLSLHSPIINKRVAVGLLAIHDKIGVINQTGLNGIYAYRIPVTANSTLSFGLQIGFSSYRANYTQLDIYQPDFAFSQDLRQSRLNFGAGVYYSSKVGYVGISMPHMMNNVFERGADLTTVYQNVPIIITSGYVFKLNHLLKLKPNMLLKVVDERAVELDVNANLLFDEVLWVGLSYKFTNAINFITEIQATDQLRIGYSYSITTGPIRRAELGSHEILVNYRFKYYKKGIVTPRYF